MKYIGSRNRLVYLRDNIKALNIRQKAVTESVDESWAGVNNLEDKFKINDGMTWVWIQKSELNCRRQKKLFTIYTTGGPFLVSIQIHDYCIVIP